MNKGNSSQSQNSAICPNCKVQSSKKYLDSGEFSIYICDTCQNGFLSPVPDNLDNYYPDVYWKYPGQLANIREGLHNILQLRRKQWLSKYVSKGDILDVGAGEGVFGKSLGPNYQVTNLESPFAQVSNKDVVKADFLKWKTEQRFDGIVFLESLEHVSSPQEYLEKAYSLLKKGGYILVECPRFDSAESKFFGKHWLHLDIPRHLSHLTEKGLAIIAKRANLVKIKQDSTLLPEFSPYCFLVSLMGQLQIPSLNLKNKSLKNLIPLSFILVFLPVAFILETIFYFSNQSPIQVSIFQKK